METPSADDARGGSPPAVLATPAAPQGAAGDARGKSPRAVVSTPARIPRAPRRARTAPKSGVRAALGEIKDRLDTIERRYIEEGLWVGTPRKRLLTQLVDKLDHMHDDLVALREWARVPRPECYPERSPDPTNPA